MKLYNQDLMKVLYYHVLVWALLVQQFIVPLTLASSVLKLNGDVSSVTFNPKTSNNQGSFTYTSSTGILAINASSTYSVGPLTVTNSTQVGTSSSDVLNVAGNLISRNAFNAIGSMVCTRNVFLGYDKSSTTTINAPLYVASTTTFGSDSTTKVTVNGNLRVARYGYLSTANFNAYTKFGSSSSIATTVNSVIRANSDVDLGSGSTTTNVTARGPVISSNDVTVAGVTYLQGSVAMGTSTSSITIPAGTINAPSTTATLGPTTAASTSVRGSVTVSGNMVVSGTLDASTTTTLGSSSFSTVTINAGSITASSSSATLKSLEATSLNALSSFTSTAGNSTLGTSVAKSVTVTGDITAERNVSVTNSLIVNGNTVLGDNIADSVTILAGSVNGGSGQARLGATTFSSLTATSSLVGQSSATFSGTLTASANSALGDETADTITINAGTISAGATQAQLGATTISSSITSAGISVGSGTVSLGSVTATTISATGSLNAYSNVNATGAVNARGNVVFGDASTRTVTVNAGTLNANAATARFGATTVSSLTSTGATTVSGSTTASGSIYYSRLCFSARDDTFQVLTFPQIPAGSVFTFGYISGVLNSGVGIFSDTRWGSSTVLGVQLRDYSSKIWLPSSNDPLVTFSGTNWYTRTGQSVNGDSLILPVFTTIPAGTYKLGFSEDLDNTSESDNTATLMCFTLTIALTRSLVVNGDATLGSSAANTVTIAAGNISAVNSNFNVGPTTLASLTTTGSLTASSATVNLGSHTASSVTVTGAANSATATLSGSTTVSSDAVLGTSTSNTVTINAGTVSGSNSNWNVSSLTATTGTVSGRTSVAGSAVIAGTLTVNSNTTFSSSSGTVSISTGSISAPSSSATFVSFAASSLTTGTPMNSYTGTSSVISTMFPYFWVRSESTAFLNVDTSNRVSRWIDQSGNNIHMSHPTSSIRPLYVTPSNGDQPYLQFDGSHFLYGTGAFTNLNKYHTVVSVFYATSCPTASSFFDMGGAAAMIQGERTALLTNGNCGISFIGESCDNSGGFTFPTNNINYIIYRSMGTPFDLWLNGVKRTSVNHCSAYNPKNNVLYIGAKLYNYGNERWQGRIYETFTFNRALSDDEIYNLHYNWFVPKYSIPTYQVALEPELIPSAWTSLSFLPTGITYTNDPIFSVSFFMYVSADISNTFRNIFQYGTSDSDRTPSLYINGLLFYPRCRSTVSWDDGPGFITSYSIILHKWIHVSWVINTNIWYFYVDGVLINTFTSSGKFTWNGVVSGRRFGMDSFNSNAGTVRIRQFYWFNTALSSSQITGLAYGISSLGGSSGCVPAATLSQGFRAIPNLSALCHGSGSDGITIYYGSTCAGGKSIIWNSMYTPFPRTGLTSSACSWSRSSSDASWNSNWVGFCGQSPTQLLLPTTVCDSGIVTSSTSTTLGATSTSHLTVRGAARAATNMNVAGQMQVNGNVQLGTTSSNTVTIGASTISAASTTVRLGAATFSSLTSSAGITATGAVTVAGALSVSGSTTLGTLSTDTVTIRSGDVVAPQTTATLGAITTSTLSIGAPVVSNNNVAQGATILDQSSGATGSLSAAIDGNTGTRYAGAWPNTALPTYFVLDLKAVYYISMVKMYTESLVCTTGYVYLSDVSSSGPWTTVSFTGHSLTPGASQWMQKPASAYGRYVRFDCSGYASIWELYLTGSGNVALGASLVSITSGTSLAFANCLDENLSTRYAGNNGCGSCTTTFVIDLGFNYYISNVRFYTESILSSSFTVQFSTVSSSGPWSSTLTLSGYTTGWGYNQWLVRWFETQGRWVRVNCGNYLSIWEFQIFAAGTLIATSGTVSLGATSISKLSSSGAITANGGLTVGGATTIAGSVTIGSAASNTITVNAGTLWGSNTGTVTTAGYTSNTMSVSSSLTANAATTVQGQLTLTASSNIGGSTSNTINVVAGTINGGSTTSRFAATTTSTLVCTNGVTSNLASSSVGSTSVTNLHTNSLVVNNNLNVAGNYFSYGNVYLNTDGSARTLRINANVMNALNSYVYTASTTVSNYNSYANAYPWSGQLMIDDVLNTIPSRTLPNPSGVNLGGNVYYTLAFWINVQYRQWDWRSVFHFGQYNWDRTPAIFIRPEGQIRLHIRHSSGRSTNDGTDMWADMGTGYWWHFAMTVSYNYMRIYVNGGYHTDLYIYPYAFNWLYTCCKSTTLNIRDYVYGNVGYVLLQKLVWYNWALSDSNIQTLYYLDRNEGYARISGSLSIAGWLKTNSYMSTPNHPAFFAYHCCTGDYAIAPSVWTTRILYPANYVRFNVGGFYNAGSYTFTAPYSGLYVTWASFYTNQWGWGNARLLLYVNGGIQLGNGNYANGLPMLTVLYLNPGDRVNMGTDYPFSWRYYGWDNHNSWGMYYIG